MELLAPAGGEEALRAAVAGGADAVYLGGRAFNARAGAANFDAAEIEAAVRYAHERRVRVYVTLNILLTEAEMEEFAAYARRLYATGADAVIVQDMGALSLLRALLPEWPVHISTQATLTGSAGCRLMESMGARRAVLARELSLAEIGAIRASTNLELEVFGHGALCVSYSGQCLFSSFIGARSGNRGRCAQPCRMAYTLEDEGGRDLLAGEKAGAHLLSPRDLNLLDHLPALAAAGASALKIEGRMKRAEYVATVVRVYRRALDGAPPTAADHRDLEQIFNREFTPGCAMGRPGREFMSWQRPNNRGLRLGRVTDFARGRLGLKLETDLAPGDGIEVWTGRGREGETVGALFDETGRNLTTAPAGRQVWLPYAGQARPGDRVFKTADAALLQAARRTFQSGAVGRQRPLAMTVCGAVGERLRLTVAEADGKTVEVFSLSPAVAARQRPLEPEYLRRQLGRLGGTPFVLAALDLRLEGDILIPVSELNEMRRAAVAQLLAETARPPISPAEWERRRAAWQRLPAETAPLPQGGVGVLLADASLLRPLARLGLRRLILSREWRRFPLCGPESLRALAAWGRERGIDFVWRLPRILHEGEAAALRRELEAMAAWPERPAIMAAGWEGLALLRETDPDWPWESDYSLPVLNNAALRLLTDLGARRVTLSPELNLGQIAALRPLRRTEAVVFGDMEMMVTPVCLPAAALGCRERAAQPEPGANPGPAAGRACAGSFYLRDRLDFRFPLETDRACRMHIFNSRRLHLAAGLAELAATGLRAVRLDLLRVTLAQAERAAEYYLEAWERGGAAAERAARLEAAFPEGFTKGHYYRGVTG
jgi:putative protease